MSYSQCPEGYYIAMAIACAFIVASCIWTLLANKGWRRLGCLVFLFLADLSMVVPVSISEYGGNMVLGLTLVPYNLFSMFLFESRIDAFYAAFDGVYHGFPVIYLATLQLLYVLSFIALAVVAVGLISSKFSNLVLRLKIFSYKIIHPANAVYIFDGLDERNLLLLRSTYKNKAHSDNLNIVTNISKEKKEECSAIFEELYKHSVLVTSLSMIDFWLLFCNKKPASQLKTNIIPECTSNSLISQSSSLYFFFFGTNEGENISKSIELLNHIGTTVSKEDRYTKGENRPRIHVYCACSGRSDELLFDSVNVAAGIDVRVIDECREIIYDLLFHHPITEAFINFDESKRLKLLETSISPNSPAVSQEAIQLPIILIGLGHYNFEALRACAALGQIPGVKLIIYAIDKLPEEKITDKINFFCPDLLSSNLITFQYYEADIISARFRNILEIIRKKCSTNPVLPYCIIAAGDDDLNIDTAILTRQIFYGQGYDADTFPPKVPLICVDIYDERKHAAVASLCCDKRRMPFDLLPFGGIAHLFSVDRIINGDLESIAFNVNASYSGALISKHNYKDLFESYSRFQMNRLSSTTMALSIKEKLWLLGYTLTKDSEEASSDMDDLKCTLQNLANLKISSNDTSQSLLEILARNEHDRWEMFYYTEGWRRMDAQSSLFFKESGISGGRHDCHLLLFHPYLCPFDDLLEIAKIVQPKGEEGAQIDPRTFDYGLIQDIARIISDEQGYTGHTFGVRKIE